MERAQEPHDLVSALPFKVSPMIPLDPLKLCILLLRPHS